ncbi:hypothetical protein Emed_005115 [Eimeria media]
MAAATNAAFLPSNLSLTPGQATTTPFTHADKNCVHALPSTRRTSRSHWGAPKNLKRGPPLGRGPHPQVGSTYLERAGCLWGSGGAPKTPPFWGPFRYGGPLPQGGPLRAPHAAS